ncbi:MAG: hypothetical protein WBQ76_06210 [Candidatus Korobacteraceae bacterium]
MKKLRKQLAEIKNKKHQTFGDFDLILRRICNRYGTFFPKLRTNNDGSRFVYDFGIEGGGVVSIEKEHGAREYIPKHFAKLAISSIDDVLCELEIRLEQAGLGESREEHDTPSGESTIGSGHGTAREEEDEEFRVLPEDEIPDRNS